MSKECVQRHPVDNIFSNFTILLKLYNYIIPTPTIIYQSTTLIYCTNFSNHHNFVNIFIKYNKFGIGGKLWPMAKWNVKVEKKKRKTEKNEDENFHINLITKNSKLKI